ncbi:MAG: hypothetical protein AAF447_11650 [Myxococcota bacterium]
MRRANYVLGLVLALGCGESTVIGPAPGGDMSLPDVGVDGAPGDGPGVGLDGGDDAGAPDGGLPDSGLPDAGLPDAGPADLGMDAGPVDAGPMDAGPMDAGPMDAGACMVGGTYDVTADPMNPALCGVIPFATCSAVQLSATSVELTCGGLMSTCTLDAMCVCSGTATASGVSGTIRVDFPAGTVQAVALGTTCDYEITLRP